MPPPAEDARTNASPRPVPKSVLQVLAFFDHRREGQCSEVARNTGLSCKTVRRRLSQLAEEGMLDVVSTKTFPRVRRFRLLESSAEAARHASSLLKKLQSEGSASCRAALVLGVAKR